MYCAAGVGEGAPVNTKRASIWITVTVGNRRMADLPRCRVGTWVPLSS